MIEPPKPPELPKPEDFMRVEPAAPRRPKTLLEMYFGSDIRRILQDMEARPQHYTREHHAALQEHLAGRPLRPEVANDLVLQFMRETAAAKEERKFRTQVTRPRDPDDEQKREKEKEAKEEEERDWARAREKEQPPFEKQELFRDAIKII